jgi:hypothetical protein
LSDQSKGELAGSLVAGLLLPGKKGAPSLKVPKGRIEKVADKFSRQPKSLQDQMTLGAARTGKGDPIIMELKDPRYKGTPIQF